jgi:hypothetical protein
MVWIVKLIFAQCLKDSVTAVNPSDISNIKDTFHCTRFEVLMVVNVKITAFWGAIKWKGTNVSEKHAAYM